MQAEPGPGAGPKITDVHKRAVRALIIGSEEEWESRFSELLDDNKVQGYSTLLAFSLGTVVRRKFSPSWSLADVVQLVARLRVNMGDQANEVDPNLAEAIIRYFLNDPSLKTNPVSSEDQESLAHVEALLLIYLVAEADLDEVEVDQLIDEAIDNTRKFF